MKITINTVDQSITFDAASVRTDEHNNLEVLGLRDKPLGLFNKDSWECALYGEVNGGEED